MSAEGPDSVPGLVHIKVDPDAECLSPSDPHRIKQEPETSRNPDGAVSRCNNQSISIEIELIACKPEPVSSPYERSDCKNDEGSVTSRSGPGVRSDQRDKTDDESGKKGEGDRARGAGGRCACALCGDEFRSPLGLKIHHSKVHSGAAVSKNSSPRDHGAAPEIGKGRTRAKMVDGEIVLTCPEEGCGRAFASRARLREHARLVHTAPDAAVDCDVCGKTFKSRTNLKVHARLVHAAPALAAACTHCGKTFKTEMLLQKHVAWSHPPDGRRHACTLCPRTLNSRAAYVKHMQMVHPPAGAVASCAEPGCGRSFKSDFHLRQHTARYHEHRYGGGGGGGGGGAGTPATHACAHCRKTYVTAGALEWHATLEHAARCVCEQCGRALPDRATLRRHALTVHSSEPHACRLCGKLFKSLMSVQQHVRVTHAPPEAAAECPDCGKLLKCRAHLQVHTRSVHAARDTERRHACAACGKRFLEARRLERHARTHLRVKSHPCAACRKPFKTSEDARRHERRVHGTKPPTWWCGECDKELSSRHGLRAHARSLHDAACYECVDCRAGFTSPAALLAHAHRAPPPAGVRDELDHQRRDEQHYEQHDEQHDEWHQQNAQHYVQHDEQHGERHDEQHDERHDEQHGERHDEQHGERHDEQHGEQHDERHQQNAHLYVQQDERRQENAQHYVQGDIKHDAHNQFKHDPLKEEPLDATVII